MTAEKRDMTDFTSLKGGINDAKNQYEFPCLRTKDIKNNIRIWKIFIRIVKDNNRQNKIDWNELNENVLQLKDEYFYTGENYTDIPKFSIVEVWTERGIEGGKITKDIPTYFEKIANEGKANQRNQLHEALIWARSQYLKRKEKGGTENKSGNKIKSNINTKYFPMLASAYKDAAKYIRYPIYVQRKYDGVRCISYYDIKVNNANNNISNNTNNKVNNKVNNANNNISNNTNNIICYSRTQRDFPGKEYIKEILIKYLPNFIKDGVSLYLDGEFYKHGLHLQDISGESRNETDAEIKFLEYHIYDCFYPNEMTMEFKNRQLLLDTFFENVNSEDKKVLKKVETILKNNKEEVDEMFNDVVKEGYEGCILRNANSPYLGNATKTGTYTRSKNVIKLKAKFTDEFEIIDFTEGKKGKAKGAIIWVCKTKKGEKFNITPKNMTDIERKKLFDECNKDNNFEKKYKNLFLTVEYEELSKKGIPQRAKGVTIRNYE
jgi:ATP-dependent DNA ligase